MNRLKNILFVVLSLNIVSCTIVGPNYVPPEMPVEKKWKNFVNIGIHCDENIIVKWWETLNDPLLDEMILRAAKSNLDIQETISRIDEARYKRLSHRPMYVPAIDLTGSVKKQIDSNSEDDNDENELLNTGFHTVWELDLFGGLKRTIEASEAEYEAEIENYRDVMVALFAEVAINYADLRTYQTRLKIAEKNIHANKEILKLLNLLYESGSENELAVVQAKYNLEAARAIIPKLEIALESSMNRLAVLTNQKFRKVHSELEIVKPVPNFKDNLHLGVPADVIRQRPDIRKAERELLAQTSKIGVAEAELYPKFSINGSFSFEYSSSTILNSNKKNSFVYGPSFNWRILDRNSVRCDIEIQNKKQKQALFKYKKAVITAFEEVENSLYAYAQDRKRAKILESAVASVKHAATLAMIKYENGESDFNNVLMAQKSLLDYEDQLARSKGDMLKDYINIYRALGGGWQIKKKRS